jgi:hypothetical protein
MNLVRWFAQAWPFPHGRKAVLVEYESLGRLPLVLTDIGLRAGLWAAKPHAASLYDAGFAAGKQAMALEIYAIVKADPMALYGYVPAKPKLGAEK